MGRHEITLKINARDRTSLKKDVYLSFRVIGTIENVYNNIIDSFKEDKSVSCRVRDNTLFIAVNTADGVSHYAVYDKSLLLNFKGELRSRLPDKHIDIILPLTCLTDIDGFMEFYQDDYAINDGVLISVTDFQAVKDFYYSLNYYDIEETDKALILRAGKTAFKVNFETPDGINKIYFSVLFE